MHPRALLHRIHNWGPQSEKLQQRLAKGVAVSVIAASGFLGTSCSTLNGAGASSKSGPSVGLAADDDFSPAAANTGHLKLWVNVSDDLRQVVINPATTMAEDAINDPRFVTEVLGRPGGWGKEDPKNIVRVMRHPAQLEGSIVNREYIAPQNVAEGRGFFLTTREYLAVVRHNDQYLDEKGSYAELAGILGTELARSHGLRHPAADAVGAIVQKLVKPPAPQTLPPSDIP